MLKFNLLFVVVTTFAFSVLTVMVFLSIFSSLIFSVEFFLSVVIGLTALLFSLEPKSPNLFFLTVGEVISGWI